MNKLQIIYNILPETGPVAFEIPEISENDKKSLKNDLKEISDAIEFKSENIGSGADWIVVIVYITGLFFLGDKINKNLNAWINLSKKFASIFKKTNIAFIDANGARLLAIEKILENEKAVKSIDEIQFHEINLLDLTKSFSDGRESNELRSKPFCYYSMIFKVNDFSYYLIGIKSNGEIRTIYKIDESHFGFYSEYKIEK